MNMADFNRADRAAIKNKTSIKKELDAQKEPDYGSMVSSAGNEIADAYGKSGFDELANLQLQAPSIEPSEDLLNARRSAILNLLNR